MDAPVTDRELELAQMLVNELTEVEHRDVRDDYAAALEQLIAVKAFGGELPEPAELPPVVDLMAALEESIQAARNTQRH